MYIYIYMIASGWALQLVVVNYNELLRTTSGCWHRQGIWYMYWWCDLGKRLVPMSFCISGLSFKTNLHCCGKTYIHHGKKEKSRHSGNCLPLLWRVKNYAKRKKRRKIAKISPKTKVKIAKTACVIFWLLTLLNFFQVWYTYI